MEPIYRPPGLTYEHYTVAILCALSKELRAVRILFDEKHPDIPTVQQDTNHYALGRIGRHNTVTTCLPSGEYGIGAASEAVQNMFRSFPKVEFCLLVGVGGGAPSSNHDIRLGDVVVSQPSGAHPAVLQHDMGKILENGDFQIIGTLQQPPRLLLKTMSMLDSSPNQEATSLRPYLEYIGNEVPAYSFPGQEKDVLFGPDSQHCEGSSCNDCTGQIDRPLRDSDEPHIHYGPIASGNQVIRSAKERDRLAAKYGSLCFEMEAGGVMNIMQCLVIRGICDYSDSHKNKIWQEYAAATAASYAKLLLLSLREHIGQIDPACRDDLPSDTPIRNFSSEDMEMSEPQTENNESHNHDPTAFLEALQPLEDPEDILRKRILFSSRRPSWNPWPADYASLRLFQDLSKWISHSDYPLLVLRGAPSRSLSEMPASDDLACHITQYLKTKTEFTVIWSFSIIPLSSQSRCRVLKLLILQALKISNYFPTENVRRESLHTEEHLVDILYEVLCHLESCFIIIETKDASLAKILKEVIERALRQSTTNLKAMIISYAFEPEQNQLMRITYVPSIRLRGSLKGWDTHWNRIEPKFK